MNEEWVEDLEAWIIANKSCSDRTANVYALTAARVLRERDIRNDYDRRAVSLLLEWWWGNRYALTGWMRGILTVNVSMTGVEHPDEIDPSHLLVTKELPGIFQRAGKAAAAVSVMDPDDAITLANARWGNDRTSWPVWIGA